MTQPPAWLDPAIAYVESWLGHQMRLTEQPGCMIAIAWRGQVVFDAAFGRANLATGEALTPRHRFRVASHSKTFTAAAVLKLREQGRLRLDDPVGQYVTGLHPEIGAATIAQALSHTAGVFRDGLDSAYWVGRAPFSDAAQIRADLALAPTIEPNTRLKYSNHGFALAGLVIEAVTGEPYADWVRREIVAPAGLGETTPDVPLPEGARLAQGHGGKALLGRRQVFPGDASTHALASATGFVSTAADLVRFFGQLSPTAETSVLSRASRREMVRPQWRDAYSAVERTYGLGVIGGAFGGWSWFGHSGGFQGYISRTAVVAAQDLAVSVLTNAADGLAHAWLDGALSILQRFAAEGAPNPAAADWTGRWWSVWGASDLVAMGDKVLLAAPDQADPLLKVPELALTGADEARIAEAGAFHSYGEPVRRVRDAAGQVVELRVAGGRALPEADLARELTERYGG
ncbi:MAG: serine hydrolase [Caulobacteraceae bacterium]|nr:serine hydrolase [Caulobacteraceae bacterium]